MEHAIAALGRLAYRDFTGAPIADEDTGMLTALVYMRWWSCGVVDVVTVLGEHEALAYRAGTVDPHRPDELSHAAVRWEVTGTALEAASAMVEAAPPREGGQPVAMPTADPHAAGHHAGELWLP